MRAMDRPALPAPARRPAAGLPARLLAIAGVVAIAATLGGAAAAAQAPEPPPPQVEAPYTLRDRIVAVVDEDPILASDLERVIALALVPRQPGEGDEAYRRRVLEQLIDNRLQAHEIDRFGLGQVAVGRVERAVAEIRARFASEEEFGRRLAEVDMDLERLRQLVARQLLVLDYIDERLAVRVLVTLEDVQKHYDEVLIPELRRRGAAVPPIAEVREDIRELLRQRKLDEEIEAWTERLRREADVSRFFAEPLPPLPPVVETIKE
jgi:hypothetical protein